MDGVGTLPQQNLLSALVTDFSLAITQQTRFADPIAVLLVRIFTQFFGSGGTTGHCRLSVPLMFPTVRECPSMIDLNERFALAPPFSTTEVHTRLGNLELGSRYGVPYHLCQYQGKLYVSRLAKGGAESRPFPFVEYQVQTGMSMMGLLALVASGFDDLAATWERTSWWVVKVHCSSIDSPCPALQSQHLLVIMGNAYWYFRLRPHGIIEILCGEGSTQFITVLPKNVNRRLCLNYLLLCCRLLTCNMRFK